MGMVESPLLVAPYIKKMSRGEIFILMTSGMATVAGTVMVVYANVLSNVIPNALGHVLTASLINAPAAIVIASLIVPPSERSRRKARSRRRSNSKSAMDAITQGTEQGVRLLINVTAMLIVLVAVRQSCKSGSRSLSGNRRAVPHIAADSWSPALAPLAFLIGIPVVRGGNGRRPPRNQDSAQRVHRLRRHVTVARRGALGTQPVDHELRPLRLCQSG